MRCTSIARAFLRAGEDVIFVTADHEGDGLLQGFKATCLNGRWDCLEAELEKIKKMTLEMKPETLIVDSYYVSESYFRELRKLTRVAYIDDLNESTWDVDYLINYNIYGSKLDYSAYARTKTKFLLGPRFTPLRDEFRDCGKHEIRKIAKDVLVSAGGADPECVTEIIIQNICPHFPDVVFHFLVGAMNPRLSDINQRILETKNAVIHINEQKMSDLMMKCDVAISAAGTTMYELCATGLPTITFTLADNQFMAAGEFAHQEIMLSAGDCRRDNCFLDNIKKCLQSLVEKTDIRCNLSNRMQAVVDGKGADRIVLEIQAG